jgi:hypothetical protein
MYPQMVGNIRYTSFENKGTENFRKKSRIFSKPADHTATLTLPPNVDPSVILEGED